MWWQGLPADQLLAGLEMNNECIVVVFIGFSHEEVSSIATFISGIVNRFDYNVDIISKTRFQTRSTYTYIIIYREAPTIDQPDYIVVSGEEPVPVELESLKKALKIKLGCSNGENLVCIEDKDPLYIASLLLALMGVPLEEVIYRVSGEDRKKVLKTYTSTIYKTNIYAVKRIDIGRKQHSLFR